MEDATAHAARQQLRRERARYVQKIAAIDDLLRGYDRLESLDSDEPSMNGQLPLSPASGMTHKDAIRKVLQAHYGPMHAKDLWDSMKALGVSSKAKDPVSVLDATILDMRKTEPIVNRGRRMYEWTGPRTVDLSKITFVGHT